jgi:hypothetical protein
MNSGLTRSIRAGTQLVEVHLMSKKLGDVEQDAATVGGDRRAGLHAIVIGRALFLFRAAAREFPRRDGQGVTTVVSCKTWTPRGGELWLEVRAPEHIALLAGLTEGQQIEFAGQLVIKQRKLGGNFVSIRVFELQVTARGVAS